MNVPGRLAHLGSTSSMRARRAARDLPTAWAPPYSIFLCRKKKEERNEESYFGNKSRNDSDLQ